MAHYFSDIYGSWESIQEEKYASIIDKLGKEFFIGKRIIDIGCGPCGFAAFLSKRKISCDVIGIDKSLKHLRQRAAHIPVMLSGTVPAKSKFDIAVAIDVVHLTGVEWPVKRNGYVIAGMFFNRSNLEKRRQFIRKRIPFSIEKEWTLKAKESEVFIVARKR